MGLNIILQKYGSEFEEKSSDIDEKGLFVKENLKALKSEGVYKMCIPKSLGGFGVSYDELCEFLKKLGAFCPSTTLTLSMHQHLICGLLVKHNNNDKKSTEMLKQIASHDLILLSTGGGDWVSSNGCSKKVSGGFKINCRKAFCSGAPLADLVFMSCAFVENDQEYVIHFNLPMDTNGIVIEDDWNAMGMRGTGSCSINFNDVFVPEENIMLKRERGKWHPALNAVSAFTFPVVVSTYAGIIEKLVEKTVSIISSRGNNSSHVRSKVGEMHNHLKITRWAYEQLVSNAKNLTAIPNEKIASEAHQAKSIFSQHSIKPAQAAMEALGGFSYHRSSGIERLYRDLIAGDFHPMQAAKQTEVLGDYVLGLPLSG